MKKAVLLDVSAIMYRAFYANLNFKTKTEPTGAVYGFINTLLSIINEFNPEYMVAAFDVSRSSLKRSELYSEYKAKRDAAPEDLIKQISRIEEVLDCFGIKKIKIDGHEADDVLGTVGKKLSADNIKTYVVTGDKDLAQILDKNISIALLGKGDGGGLKILSTPEQVVEQIGVRPELIPDLFGLIGDSSDGIPGVRKIGVKKAVPMIDKYGNLEGVYENLDKLTELPGIGKSLVQNMIDDKELAFLSKKLATIEILPLDINLEDLKYKIQEDKMLKLFQALEFKSLIKKMKLSEKEEVVAVEKVSTAGTQLGLFNFLGNEMETESGFRIIDGKKLSTINNGPVSIYYSKEGMAISVGTKDMYLPLNSKENIDELKNFLQKDIEFVTYNFKPILNDGFKIKNMKFDTMIAFHLLTSQTREEVEVMLDRVVDEDLEKYSEVFGKTDSKILSSQEYGQFLVKRSRGILMAYDELVKEIQDNSLTEVLQNIEMPLIEILSSMEVEGIKIDKVYFENYSKELEIKLEKLTEKIYEIAGTEFNINSPKQLSEILFINLNLNPIKKNKTGLSTSVEVLEELQDKGVEIAKYILEFRKLTKLKTTYVDPLPKIADKESRLHTTFNQTGTATGRLSSSNPNLQNIPVKTEEGIKIREGFVAKDGTFLLGVDYSQIELRVLAELSGDEQLIAAYNRNEDLHSLTAKKIFQLKDDEPISREQRTAAKIVNFSIIYGKTAFGLSQELKITPKEAGEYIERYFEQYPRVKELEGKILKSASENGYVETYFNRKRIIEGINSKNNNIRKQAERMAVNSVIQGTAAEILKKVMIELYKVLKDKTDIKLLLQVHDELIFEIDKDKVQMYKEIIEKTMTETIKFKNVKLEVNSSVGKNWAETK